MEKKGKVSMGTRIVAFFLASLLSVLAIASSLYLLICLIPTAVAFFADKSPGKARAKCVLSFNLAMTGYYLLDIWAHGNALSYTFGLLSEIVPVITAYAGALGGYMFYSVIMPICGSTIQEQAKKRIEKIDERQAEMKKRWGVGVDLKKSQKEPIL